MNCSGGVKIVSVSMAGQVTDEGDSFLSKLSLFLILGLQEDLASTSSKSLSLSALVNVAFARSTFQNSSHEYSLQNFVEGY